MPEILEHSGGNAHTRCRECRPEECVDVDTVLRQQQGSDPPAERPRGDHAEDRHGERPQPNLHHVSNSGLESHLEQQYHCAQLGQHSDRSVGSDKSEPADADEGEVPDEDSNNQLAEHRRLADTLGGITAEFGCCKNNGQREDNRRERVRLNHVVEFSASVSVHKDHVGADRGLLVTQRSAPCENRLIRFVETHLAPQQDVIRELVGRR